MEKYHISTRTWINNGIHFGSKWSKCYLLIPWVVWGNDCANRHCMVGNPPNSCRVDTSVGMKLVNSCSGTQLDVLTKLVTHGGPKWLGLRESAHLAGGGVVPDLHGGKMAMAVGHMKNEMRSFSSSINISQFADSWRCWRPTAR